MFSREHKEYIVGFDAKPGAVKRRRQKSLVVVSIVIPIAMLHFFTGHNYRGPYPEFVNGYLLDILVPFAFYFLLCLPDAVFLRSWVVKALPVFAVGCAVEIAQFYGAPILGRTFDPLDFLMYGIGVLSAAALDMFVFPRIFGFWAVEKVNDLR